jgi:uncharacterized protein YggE
VTIFVSLAQRATMKKRFIVALAGTALSLSSVWSQTTAPPPPQITVSGSAEIKVAPDEVHLSAGVETRSDKLDDARRQNDDRVGKVLQFLKAQGIKEKDVQTDFMSVEPNYDSKVSRSDAAVYVVRKTIGVRLTDVTKFDAVLSGLLITGVNHVNGIEFRTSELRKHRDAARAMAIKAAREKADALANELGVKRGKVYSINATEGGGWSASGYWGGRSAGMAQNVVQNAGGGPEDTGGTLSVGQITVSATVNVSFLIE